MKKKRKKTDLVHFRAERGLRILIERNARRNGDTVSAWLRKLCIRSVTP